MSYPKIRKSGEVVVLLARDHEGGQVGRVDGQEHNRKQRPDARHKSEHFLVTSVPDSWHFGVDPDPDGHKSEHFLLTFPYNQCSGSMKFWCGCGSGSADPCLWLIDPDPDSDPDSAIFVTDLQDANKKLIFTKSFCAYNFFEGTFTSFFKDKKSKRSHKTVGIKVFSYYFCLMIEGWKKDPDPEHCL
jgi:hypothetical protein